MTSRPIVIWGAAGHAKVLAELLPSAGYRPVALFDNDPAAKSPLAGVPLFIGQDGLGEWLRGQDLKKTPVACLVAIGGARGRDRLSLQDLLAAQGLQPIVAIHRSAFVAPSAQLGPGSQVLAQAAVAADATLGKSCIVNTSASVDHEARLGDGVHIAPGAVLAGCVSVGECTLIGTAAVILPRVRIGAHAIVGAGAVVTRDVPDRCVAYGNPARVIRENPA